MNRRSFLKKIGKAGIGVLVAGAIYKGCIDDFIDHPESFAGFQEKAEDGWKVKEVSISTRGDIIHVAPAYKSKIGREVLPNGDVQYHGLFYYEIRKRAALERLTPYHPTKYQEEQLKSGDYWRDERYGSVTLTKKKK
jgi:hypothetical protein